MYFNFDGHPEETPTIPRSFTRLEASLITLVSYMAIVIAYLLVPEIPFLKELEAQRLQAIEERVQREMELARQMDRERERARFVFVDPRVDLQARRPPERAELSDIDRQARTVERAPNPTNPMPFSRGNSAERMEAPEPVAPRPDTPRGEPSAEPTPSAPAREPAEIVREGLTLPVGPSATEPRASEQATTPRGAPSGILTDAIRNVQKYVENETFGNLKGGGTQDLAPSIQFDTKGVEFGPWLRRFIAQIRRNWFVPYAAMSMRGHVVITFYVHKDGRISELAVMKPASIEAFNNSAFNALASSNPTHPLPPEYPDDRAFFTVTFFFNETP
ncbi:MAG: TonB family protein [Acidobacteria bacterium]|nr:TonB family protein [Acidobacteriota bacterium]